MKILVDADALIAIMKHDDSNHTVALDHLERLSKLEVIFLTTNYVISEVITVLSQRVTHATAIQFIKIIRSTDSPFTIHWIDETVEDKAIAIFAEQTSKNVSLVDCTNMALMQLENIDQIFSFDAVYRKNGIMMVEEGESNYQPV
jgi:predicted nucleic acid-binding protein